MNKISREKELILRERFNLKIDPFKEYDDMLELLVLALQLTRAQKNNEKLKVFSMKPTGRSSEIQEVESSNNVKLLNVLINDLVRKVIQADILIAPKTHPKQKIFNFFHKDKGNPMCELYEPYSEEELVAMINDVEIIIKGYRKRYLNWKIKVTIEDLKKQGLLDSSYKTISTHEAEIIYDIIIEVSGFKDELRYEEGQKPEKKYQRIKEALIK